MTPVVAAVIRVFDGRVLLTQRTADQTSPLKWHFVGGKVKAGETREAALIREVREELCIEVRPGRLLNRRTVRLDYGTFDVSFYECSVSNLDGIRPRECAGFAVVPLATALGFDMISREETDVVRLLLTQE